VFVNENVPGLKFGHRFEEGWVRVGW